MSEREIRFRIVGIENQNGGLSKMLRPTYSTAPGTYTSAELRAMDEKNGTETSEHERSRTNGAYDDVALRDE